MRKLLFFIYTLLITLTLLFLPSSQASANKEVFMRVLEKDVYIYSDNTLSNKLFEIPYSYYVKIESVQGDTARVLYGKDNESYPVIMGYCRVSELSEVSITPLNPYSVIKVSTMYSDVLFNDYNFTKAYFNVPENTFMIYYGSCKTSLGTTVSYVYCNNKLGYYDVNSLNPFSVPENTDEIYKPPTNEGEEESPKEENEKPSSLPAESLQIIIILGLSIISISIVYYLFKPTSKKVEPQEFYKEDG